MALADLTVTKRFAKYEQLPGGARPADAELTLCQDQVWTVTEPDASRFGLWALAEGQGLEGSGEKSLKGWCQAVVVTKFDNS